MWLCYTCNGRGGTKEVAATYTEEEMADFAAWRARTVLFTTWQYSLYIPLSHLQNNMQALILSTI